MQLWFMEDIYIFSTKGAGLLNKVVQEPTFTHLHGQFSNERFNTQKITIQIVPTPGKFSTKNLKNANDYTGFSVAAPTASN